MRTAIIKCTTPRSSHNALCIVDSKGTEAYIPFQFVLDKKYHEATKEVCEVTIPLWLAIDRGVEYQNK